MRTLVRFAIFFPAACLLQPAVLTYTQSANSFTIYGTVTGRPAAVILGTSVIIGNPVSPYSRSVQTDKAGHYPSASIPNLY